MQTIEKVETIRKREQHYFAGGAQSYTLMQRAGLVVSNMVQARYAQRNVIVLAGCGNNGGDGFIVAEDLRKNNAQVAVYALNASVMQGDAKKARDAYQGITRPISELRLEENPVIVDALFGIGLNKPLSAELVALINRINAQKLDVVAVDIPSGIDADTGNILGAAIKATLTVTFIAKKYALVLLPSCELCGEVIVDNLGIAIDSNTPSSAYENTPELWHKQMPWPTPSTHKYQRGHTLVIGGGIYKAGAAKLAAKAAQRMGSGLVTIMAAPEDAIVYASSALSLMTTSNDQWRQLLADERINTIVIGPGAGVHEQTRMFVLDALAARKRMVIDADALTVFADNPAQLFAAIQSPCILTPHAGEFSKLFPELQDLPKYEAAQEAAEISHAVVIYKGYDTVVAASQGIKVINTNAQADLATAGTGDVLAGLCAGLLAQGMEAFPAACAAVWLHADAAKRHGTGLIAEDILDNLPTALHRLKNYVIVLPNNFYSEIFG